MCTSQIMGKINPTKAIASPLGAVIAAGNGKKKGMNFQPVASSGKGRRADVMAAPDTMIK